MRYLPLTDAEREEMLKDIGISSVLELFSDIPQVDSKPIELPVPKNEVEVERKLTALAGKNISAAKIPSFLGAGAYRHHIPALVDYMIERGEFLTSYTPYQPEVSQGTLQILFEFQTQVARLFGLDVANASLYDGASAAFEAAAMAERVTGRKKIIVSGGVHPQVADTVKSCLQFNGTDCVVLPPDAENTEAIEPVGDEACVIVQYPSFFGHVNDYSALAEACHAKGALLVVVVMEPLALGILKSPGDMGADIAVGEGMGLASHLNFGGPGLGLFATRKELVRNMPGRLVGETKDADGKRGFVLTMATREQHIRREKATSNICTNAGLMAVAFSMHLAMLGEKGFTKLAESNHARTSRLASEVAKIPGVTVLNKTFFNELTLKLDRSAAALVEKMAGHKMLGGVPVSRFYPDKEDLLLVARTETNNTEEALHLQEELKK
ncbi:MAG: aminomethyl-transferring glycine dehydrogenase subunit GcvPA [Alphaproteobacteria bacterium]|nr:aminomethyl-transferring glycine dehydrogenase subunit GcvPA [Alphaproteobacteria bacterium]